MSDDTRDTQHKRPGGLFSFLSKSRATKPGEIYGVPGQGETLWLSLGSIAVLLFVWWLVTAMGWVKPLFVPSPGAIVQKFVDVWQNGFTNTAFHQHIWVSTARVFGGPVFWRRGGERVRRGEERILRHAEGNHHCSWPHPARSIPLERAIDKLLNQSESTRSLDALFVAVAQRDYAHAELQLNRTMMAVAHKRK
mgnify:CR=1 FL=1